MQITTGHRGIAIGALCALAVVLHLAVTPGLAAQEWSGSIGLAGVGQDTGGSEASFRTQSDLDEGLVLEELELAYDGGEGSDTTFTLRAWGFGGAEPASRAKVDLGLGAYWHVDLDYDRRDSFFALAGTELGLRSDEWEVERWRAGVTWDGWNAARLRFDLDHTERSGTVARPLFELNETYPLLMDLDEGRSEATLALETRNLPVQLVLEQSYAVYERTNRRRIGGELSLDGDDPDVFLDATETRDEERTVPTTRVIATWAGEAAEVAASLLYRPAELDSDGLVGNTFGIAGGSVGTVELADDVVASADADALVGDLRLGFHLGSAWTLRVDGDYRDTATDAALVGRTLLRITNPLGGFELAAPVDDATVFDVTESGVRLTLEWRRGAWTAWGGALSEQRDVDWRRGADADEVDVSRDSDGVLAGLAYRRTGLSFSAEVEHGSFDDLVFRTDPETVDRLTLRYSNALGGGWGLRLQGRFEEADNDGEDVGAANVDRSAESYGAGVTWDSDDGDSGFGLDVDLADFSSDVALVLPDGSPGLSVYDLSLLTTTLHGRTRAGVLRLAGSATRVEDAGDTWPVESWIARARAGVEVVEGTELSLFGEYWEYDEERAEVDDFDVLRYGVAVNWRLP